VQNAETMARAALRKFSAFVDASSLPRAELVSLSQQLLDRCRRPSARPTSKRGGRPDDSLSSLSTLASSSTSMPAAFASTTSSATTIKSSAHLASGGTRPAAAAAAAAAGLADGGDDEEVEEDDDLLGYGEDGFEGDESTPWQPPSKAALPVAVGAVPPGGVLPKSSAEASLLTSDLSKASDEDVARAKSLMSTAFRKNQVRPGDPSFQYDVQVDFGEPEEPNDWD
jgi:hypothetical protein